MATTLNIFPVDEQVVDEKSVPDVWLLEFLLLDAKPRESTALAGQQTNGRLLTVSKNTKC